MKPLAALFLPLAVWAQPDDRINATLWVQTSEEFRGAALGAFRAAARQLDRALKDRKWTAAVEQPEPFARLPPAVILDIDETVLDNSSFQVRGIRRGVPFDRAMWDQWVAEAAAGAVPGAVEFCRAAAARKVAVFYISNREQKHEPATRANLQAHGFPLSDSVDTVLLRGETPEWTGDKGTRRRHVAERYRVLLIVGDDLGDFLSNVRVPLAERRKLAASREAWWGERWIAIPNPMYGSWEDTAAAGGSKRGALR
jgi:5'-nucleotidase (lipoprotein e(P4) family)